MSYKSYYLVKSTSLTNKYLAYVSAENQDQIPELEDEAIILAFENVEDAIDLLDKSNITEDFIFEKFYSKKNLNLKDSTTDMHALKLYKKEDNMQLLFYPNVVTNLSMDHSINIFDNETFLKAQEEELV